MFGGCVITELWKSEGSAYEGGSLNTYDPATGRWTQVWTDNVAGRVEMSGEWTGGAMVLTGKRPDGATTRMTYRPGADGTVRQTVEVSRDGGANWATTIDLIYRRAAAAS